MGNFVTASGSKIYISGAPVTSAIDTVPEFEAISTWTEIKEVESLGEYGDEANIVTGADLSTSRMQKAKGVRDAGTLALVCFHDPNDAGQQAAIAAEATNQKWGFKITLPDAVSTVEYFRALVASKRRNVGNADNIIRLNFNLAIDSEIFSEPASA